MKLKVVIDDINSILVAKKLKKISYDLNSPTGGFAFQMQGIGDIQNQLVKKLMASIHVKAAEGYGVLDKAHPRLCLKDPIDLEQDYSELTPEFFESLQLDIELFDEGKKKAKDALESIKRILTKPFLGSGLNFFVKDYFDEEKKIAVPKIYFYSKDYKLYRPIFEVFKASNIAHTETMIEAQKFGFIIESDLTEALAEQVVEKIKEAKDQKAPNPASPKGENELLKQHGLFKDTELDKKERSSGDSADWWSSLWGMV